MREVSILVCGECGVGKTSVVLRYIQNEFVTYDPTIMDCFRKEDVIVNENLLLNITETNTDIEDAVYMNQGFLLIYDVTNESSLEPMMEVCKRIRQVNHHSVVLLFGNKNDLVSETGESSVNIQKMSTLYNIDTLMGSAKNDTNIKQCMHRIAQQILGLNKTIQPPVHKKHLNWNLFNSSPSIDQSSDLEMFKNKK
ncbi:Ras GTPase [Acrasis kona]|uniref:Ras GTPase n=1 Tax=Acrasis kona TaxID=1008807 RepID=A0AAW2YSC3_9EUKA